MELLSFLKDVSDPIKRRKKLLIVVPLAFALLFAFVPGFEGYITHIGVLVVLYILLALGLNVVPGFTGLLDLGYVGLLRDRAPHLWTVDAQLQSELLDNSAHRCFKRRSLGCLERSADFKAQRRLFCDCDVRVFRACGAYYYKRDLAYKGTYGTSGDSSPFPIWAGV